MKIGVFDSGLGGLTIVQEIIKSFDSAEIYYIADTKFAPYGVKTTKEILQRSIDITKYFLNRFKIDVLVVACNTATSAAINDLRNEFKNLIIIGTEPGIKPAMLITKSKNIGVLATNVTLGGQKYKNLLNKLSNEYVVNVYENNCKGLVEEIENGKISDINTYNMLKNWLEPMKNKNVDTIVLGCTHYPLVSPLIRKIMGDEIQLIETGEAIARRLQGFCTEQNIDKNEVVVKIFYTGEIKKDMISIILNDWQDCGNVNIKDFNE